MRHITIVLGGLLLASVGLGQHEDERMDPKAFFQKTMMEGLDLEEVLISLDELVKKHPRCVWADDALWVMGEMSRQAKARDKELHYKSELMQRFKGGMHLQRFTRTLKVFKKSFVPVLEQAYRDMGHMVVKRGHGVKLYRPTQTSFISNPLPVAVQYDLARLYEKKGDFVQAARCYRYCLSKLPKEGFLTKFVREQYESIRELAEHQRRAKGGSEDRAKTAIERMTGKRWPPARGAKGSRDK